MYTKKTLHLFLAISIMLVVSSCIQPFEKDERIYKVLVLHSYYQDSEYYKQSVALFDKYFKEEGLQVELIHKNGDMPHMSRQNMVRDALSAEVIDIEYEEPDLTIVNDDDMFHAVFQDSAWLSKRPLVFGGVNYMGDVNLSRFNNITGFTDKPDLEENLRLIKELTGTNIIFTELDSEPEDSLREVDLQKAIANLGWKQLTPNELLSNEMYKSPIDSICVVEIAATNTHLNIEAQDSDMAIRIHEAGMLDAKYVKHLQLRWSSTSNTYIDRSVMPQFTCVNQLFGDSKIRFLAGYFCSLETQIRDEVHYAAQILRGTSIALLPIKNHEKDYFMDFRAMKLLKMDVAEYRDKFQIINMPFKDRHEHLFWFLVISGIIAALSVVIAITWLTLSKYNKKYERIIQELQENNEKRDLALGESKTILWQIKDGALHLTSTGDSYNISALRERVDDEYKPFIDRLLGMGEIDGKHVIRVRLLTKDNTYAWYEIIYNLTPRNRKEKHLEGVAMDITDAKLGEDTILKANESQEIVNIKETIMANMSHDIRTPLGAVVGFADIMAAEGELLTLDERKEYAGLIKQNSKMLATMIGDILDSKSEIGVFKFHKEQVNISELIHTVWTNNRVLCPKNLKLRELQDSDTQLCLYIDPHRIQEVLNNFLSNAFKFTHSGQVIIGWQQVNHEVELYVQDNGVGIAPDKLSTVFERYYKTSEVHKGTGMGLNICKTIIEQHNGRVEAKSKLGEGSRFSAFLKLDNDGKEVHYVQH